MTEFLKLMIPWFWGDIDWITDSFITTIFLCTSVLGIWFWVKTFCRWRLIDRLTKYVNKYSRPASPTIIQKLAEKFNEHNDEHSNAENPSDSKRKKKFNEHNDELSEVWQEFADSLITREKNNNQKIVYKTDEASLFFSEDRLLEQHLNLRFWNSVPALLVGLGILGTFVGLVWGLLSFSDINFENTDEIQRAIKQLLSGVSIAFVTSVWGMLFSLLFNALEKWLVGRVGKAIADLQRALDRLFTLTTQEEISLKQQDELAQQTRAFKELSTDLASAIFDKLAPSFDKLNTAVEKLLEHKDESSIEAIEKLVEEFQKSFSGSAKMQMEDLAKNVSKASESLITLPEQLSKVMADVQKQVNEAHQLLYKTFQEAIATHQQGLSATTGAVTTASNQSIQTLKTVIAELQKAMTHTASQTTEKIESFLEQQQKAIGFLTSQTADRLDETFKTGEESVKNLLVKQGEQIEAVNSQLENSEKTLRAGSNMLEKMNTSIESAADIIEKMRGLSNLLNGAAMRLESTGSELTEASRTFNKENEKYLAANRATIQQIQNALQESRQLLGEFAKKFQTIDKGLQGIFDEIENGLTSYSTTTKEAINKYLNEFSNQLSVASKALAESVQALTDTVVELTELIERISNAKNLP